MVDAVKAITLAVAWLLPILIAVQPVSAQERVASLPALNARLNETSVSGISSGADMAHQLHIANSGIMVGAGLVSVAPYHCAEGLVTTALARCMEIPGANWLKPEDYLVHAQYFERSGGIDPLDNLKDDRVYLFSGTEDQRRVPVVVQKTTDFYKLIGVPEEQIRYKNDLEAGHAFVTEDWGNQQCEVSEPPFINDCNYDQAGAILQWIYGPLNPPANTLEGRLIQFDQQEFVSNLDEASMAREGFAYIPAPCEKGSCRIHVALHGCRQGAIVVGDAFFRHAGYNEWADTNRIIVLYPQAQAMTVTLMTVVPDPYESNPKGCWNWWGYGNDDHYSRRTGVQVRAIRSMIDRLSAGD